MAIMPPFSQGTPGFRDTNGTSAHQTVSLGTGATITITGASVAIQLPVDPATGALYRAYRISCNAAVWFNFNTAGDAAVAGAANNHLVGPNSPIQAICPFGAIPGATAQISAIADAGGAAKVCVCGMF